MTSNVSVSSPSETRTVNVVSSLPLVTNPYKLSPAIIIHWGADNNSQIKVESSGSVAKG